MKKLHDHNEWGNIGNPEDFNKSNYVYSKTKAMREAQSKRNKDPEWRAKIKHANNNWSEERKAAYQNRDKSYLDKNSEWYQNQVKSNAKSRIPVQAKKLDGEWVKFDSVRDFAATTENADMFENNPGYYFPKDMSVKTIKHSKSPYKGWQFQRLKEKQW